VIVQPLACEAVNVCPFAVIVADRAGPLFAAAEKLTVPFPDPLAPEVICSQPSLDDADHEQDPGAVIEKLPVPPAASKAWDVGLIAYVHVSPDCDTPNEMPAIVRVDARGPELFGSTVSCTVPGPVPLVPAVIRAHPSGAEADHEQLEPVVTVIEVEPPASLNDAEVGASEYEQPAF
jgi:hypothetical protein